MHWRRDVRVKKDQVAWKELDRSLLFGYFAGKKYLPILEVSFDNAFPILTFNPI